MKLPISEYLAVCSSDADCVSDLGLRCQKSSDHCEQGKCQCSAGYIFLRGLSEKCLRSNS